MKSLPKEGSRAPEEDLSRRTRRRLFRIYVANSYVAATVVLFLSYLGLGLTASQWVAVFAGPPLVVVFFTFLGLHFLNREYRPVGAVLEQIERRQRPPASDLSRAVVQALNLPERSFLWIALYHGPISAAITALIIVVSNVFFEVGYKPWQALIFEGMILVGAPTQAMFQFFAVLRCMTPVLEQLLAVGGIQPDHQRELRSSRLQNKLLFLVIFLTTVPLAFMAVSILLKAHSSAEDWAWAAGVMVVCSGGCLGMAILTAREVSGSTVKLLRAMNEVERGKLDVELRQTSTDEFGDLFRGFNLMNEQLRDEARIIKMSEELMGELQLDLLLRKIIHATIELLGAERGTLFIYDPKTNELWSRVASGGSDEIREIRVPATAGIAGAVFTSGKPENISRPYEDPRFNPEVDRRTGYRTNSMLTMPIAAKNGKRIGVTQVLNKRGGQFTDKDGQRLAAFTTQIAIALENARLFDDVLRMKNFNESMLRSTSNGMITLDERDRVTSVNEASLAILQVAREALVGQTAAELFQGSNEWVLASLAKVSSTGVIDVAVDTDLRLANGKAASVNLTAVPLIDTNDESIGTMLILDDITQEKRIKTTMSRYMSKEIADQLLAAGETLLGGKDQKVTILFSDIRSFTSISEALGAHGTVAMLNEYFEAMVDVVFRHGGILDKYIGDAIMALFGSPLERPEDADNAVAVANQMLVTLQSLNERRAASGRPPIDIGIGIATGQVIAGSIGSPKRMEYTAIGDSVNLSSRLEGATKIYGVKILVSESTVRELRRPARLREIDLLRVKGKDQPVAVYEALDHFGPESFPAMDDVLEDYRCGLDRYRQQDWHAATRHFESALARNPNDRPSQIYLERCRHFAAEPPPDGWKGVWVLSEK